VTVVIDSSALVAYLLEESKFEKIRDLLAAGVESPALLVMEASNAVLEVSRSKRIGRESADKAIGVMLNLLESNVKVHEERDLVQSAFRIAADHGLTAYDSVYLALAKKLHGSLASRDRKQVETAKALGIEVAST
jgi:predicted nucleic acid-binding protein